MRGQMVRRCWHNSKEKESNFMGGIWYQRSAGWYITIDSRNREINSEEDNS